MTPARLPVATLDRMEREAAHVAASCRRARAIIEHARQHVTAEDVRRARRSDECAVGRKRIAQRKERAA